MTFIGNELAEITDKCESVKIEDSYAVFYGNVLLWTHPYKENPGDIEGYVISMVDEGRVDGVKIIGKVPVINVNDDFDFTHYGSWEDVDDAMNWLMNPVEICSDNQEAMNEFLKLFDHVFEF